MTLTPRKIPRYLTKPPKDEYAGEFGWCGVNRVWVSKYTIEDFTMYNPPYWYWRCPSCGGGHTRRKVVMQ